MYPRCFYLYGMQTCLITAMHESTPILDIRRRQGHPAGLHKDAPSDLKYPKERVGWCLTDQGVGSKLAHTIRDTPPPHITIGHLKA